MRLKSFSLQNMRAGGAVGDLSAGEQEGLAPTVVSPAAKSGASWSLPEEARQGLLRDPVASQAGLDPTVVSPGAISAKDNQKLPSQYPSR